MGSRRPFLVAAVFGVVSSIGFAQTAPPSVTAAVPTQAERAFTKWARKLAIPLKTTAPGNNFSDMAPLGDVVGNARIVELGEATHGTSEFFQMKDRMVRYLAAQKGFTVFSIEANMPEAYRLNDFVLHGKGDPKALLKGMNFWIWNTQEVLEMILWMHQYNLSGKGRIQFTGFDMQTSTLSIETVRQFVAKYDPSYSPQLGEAYNDIGNAQKTEQIQLCRGVLEELEARRRNFTQAGASTRKIDWAIQNARLLTQYEERKIGGVAARDRAIAENIEWIANQNPGAKIIVWAHNGHISYQPYGGTPSMGGYLKQYFGPQIVNFGLVFDHGSFRAVDPNKHRLATFRVNAAPKGSWESALAATNLPLFALELRRAVFAPETFGWMVDQHRTHSLGAVYVERNAAIYWYPTQLQKEFDAIFFIEKTTASHGLP